MCLVYVLSFRLDRDFVAAVMILDLVLGSRIVTEHANALLYPWVINFICIIRHFLQEGVR